MENLLKIYDKFYEVLNYEKESGKEFEKIKLYNENGCIAEIYLPSNFDSISIILSGAGYNDKTKKIILKNLNFLLKEKIGLCIFEMRESSLNKIDQEFFEFFKRVVGEVRGIIKFIDSNFKGKNINIIGVSLGGIIGFIVGAKEKGIKKFVFLVTGANIELITWRSFLRFYLKKDCKRNVCRRMHKIYKHLLKNKFYNEIQNLPRKCFLYDPLTYTENFKNREILMINGLFDFIIPFWSVIEIKKKIKNAEVLWYPGTHLTLKYFLPFYKKKILKFLKNGN
jgi:pimeloyl-ACP methyl ester carboxylesterase